MNIMQCSMYYLRSTAYSHLCDLHVSLLLLLHTELNPFLCNVRWHVPLGLHTSSFFYQMYFLLFRIFIPLYTFYPFFRGLLRVTLLITTKIGKSEPNQSGC